MDLQILSVNRSQYERREFPLDYTYVLRVFQVNGLQIFVGKKDSLLLFGAHILDLISVRSVKLSHIEDYE